MALISCSAVGKNEITWYSYDQPPAAFLRGAYQGQGYIEKVRDLIAKQLPHYQHHIQDANIGRFIFDIKHGKNACFPALIKTNERQAYVHYSQTSVLQYNVQVVMKKSMVDSLQLSAPVALDSLFKHHHLKLAKVDGRSYTPVIDTLLAQYPSYIINRSTNSISQLFHMLIKGRVDFLLSYPSVSNYQLKQFEQLDNYVSLPIAGVDLFLTSHVGCTKNEWGEAVVADIDKALLKAKQSPAYFRALTAWLNKQQVTDSFIDTYQQLLLKAPSQ